MSDPTFWDVLRTGAYIVGAGVVIPLIYRAIRFVRDDLTDYLVSLKQKRLTLEHIEQQNKVHRVRRFEPGESGRLGVTYDGETYRDLDNLRVFTQLETKYLHPILEKLDAIQKTLLAMRGIQFPSQNIKVGDIVTKQAAGELVPGMAWPAVVDLCDLFRDRRPTIYDLVVGIRPNESGGLDTIGDSLHNIMHVLEVGASGWGKSTWLRSFLWQIAKAREPVEVVAVDINGSEFNILRDWGKLRYPVARTTDDVIAVLDQVSLEIARRKAMYEQYPLVTKLTEYNEATGADLPPWVVAIDEGTNLLNQRGSGEPLQAAVQTARQYGVYILLAGQSAKHSVIDTQIRDQFSTRLCFRTSPTSSRVVLDDQAAGDLHDKGRAWVQMAGREMLEVQGPYVSREAFLQALSNGGPRFEMPIRSDGDHDRGSGTGPTADQVARVIEMHQAGESKRAIEQAVFGFEGGAAYRAVTEILKTHSGATTATATTGSDSSSPGVVGSTQGVVVAADFCDLCGRSVDDAPAGVTFGTCAACGVSVCSDDAIGNLCPDCTKT